MQANFSEFDFLGTALKLRKRRTVSSSLVYVLHKHEVRHFHVVVVQKQQTEKCTKKRDARANLLFCSINLLLFSRSRCRRRLRSKNSVIIPMTSVLTLKYDFLNERPLKILYSF